MTRYLLYQTLCENIPEKDLTIKDKTWLTNQIESEETTQTQLEAIGNLIREHTRVEGLKWDSNNLPYKIEETDTDTVINLDNLPQKLKWILYKFMQVNKK